MNAETETKPQPPTRISTLQLRDAKTIGEALQTVQFQRAVTDAAPSHMTPNRLMATFRQVARSNPAFTQCSLSSVLGVFMTCTFLGLEPNTPLGHAYMIPFAKKRWDKASRSLVDDGYDLQLIIGYQGYLDLAYRNPRVSSVAAHAVYEGDDFSFEYGSNEHLQHRPKGLHADTDMPRYFYMFSKLQGGQAFEVLPFSKVIQTRNGSQGYRAAVAAKEKAEEKGWRIPASYTEAPWVKHLVAMGQKTAMRAGYKWLPKTVEMAAVTRLEDAQDRGRIDFGPVLEGSVNPLEEDLPMIAEPGADPGAAFGTRDQDEEPGAVAPLPGEVPQPRTAAPPAPVAREPAPSAPPAPVTPPPPSQAPPAAAAKPPVQGFAAHLAGADGEIVERYGDSGYITDEVAFARAYAEVWRVTAIADLQALAEHNADGLQDAAANTEAAAILAGLVDAPAPAAAPAAPAGPVAITVVTTNGRPDLKGYLDALRAAAAAQTAESFLAWDALQRPMVATISTVTRRAAEKILADRATALGTDKPPAAPPLPAASQAAADSGPPSDDPPPNMGDDPPAAQPQGGLMGEPLPPEPWSRRAQDIVDQLNACKSIHDLDALGNNAATGVTFRLITEASADEGQRLKAFAQARRVALTPRT